MNVNHVIHNDRSRFAVLCITFASLLLVGCMGKSVGEKRGFIYQSPAVSFACQHEPKMLEVKVDKAVLDSGINVAVLDSGINVLSAPKENGKDADKPVPHLKEFVEKCKAFIDSAKQ